ncbi:MAG: hypothetical protein DRQ88_02865 [Epsilonproteobacteria bacterium]|nr:MAG: hypothetical protein DRQ89_01820 [Campylobacterota bacterium]RLA67414.1 MAG: hypothetical protein DRQ88_02865 [Campylobacterota bacterium]
MIEINILDSCDPAVIGPYISLKDVISIGRASQNDIIVRDKDLSGIHFYIELTKNGLICWNANIEGDYLSNEKLYKGKKIHQKNEKIKIGTTSFEIINYSVEKKTDPDELLKSSYQNTMKKYSHQGEVIDEIENELGNLEDLINK